MSTPKDALYKQRQVEFRKLNSVRHQVPKEVVKHGEYVPAPMSITHKDIYKGTIETPPNQ